MDVLGLTLIGFGVGTVVIALVISIARRPKPPPPDRRPPTFRIVALGLEGSGKTVLLASQFHKLGDPLAGRQYFLDGHFEQDQSLAWTYARVSDTKAPWPAGTQRGDTREFLFNCMAYGTAGDEQTVFRMSYLDYAGDLLELRDEDYAAQAGDAPDRAGEHAVQGVMAKVDDADALLVIIDGRRVLQLLRDDPAGHDYFDRRLRPLLRVAGRASCPVQLILTKWDLVRSFGELPDDDKLLRLVSDRLTGYGSIKALVHAHGRRQMVRLIPVSAVGSEFVELRGGETIKRADGTLDPIHVDVPLCAVLPDVVTRVEHLLDASMREELEADIGDRLLHGATSIVAAVLTSPVGTVLRNALRGVVGDDALKVFVEILVGRKSPGVEPPSEDDEAETQRLRAEVIKHMERVVLRFEARLPSSILSNGG